MPGSLLVNFVYCHPVGHVVEALHLCHGHHRADPGLRIGLVLNAATPVELARLCPFVAQAHAVEVDVGDGSADFSGQLAAIARDWDQVVEDERADSQREVFPGLAAYYRQSRRHFRPAGARFPYAAGEAFRLPIARDSADGDSADGDRADGDGVRIAVLPGGSGPRRQYPSVRSWRLVLDALADRFPGAEFVLVGKLRADGRTSTSFGRAEFAELLGAVRSVDAVDLPLVDQLARVASSDVLVSPHSGFAMAALAVGTPWLAISGNRWPEYYFPGTPFYSVLPDLARFPAFGRFAEEPEPVHDDGPRSPSMSFARIAADLPEIVEGAARLVERRWDFDTALADHVRRAVALGLGDTMWSVDDVHRRHLPQ
ncbi:hypothetical protein ABZ816_04600 [Actinosynnema sp. NPDC047251]|uniref:ADP-heptose:LPS heptosyltransferase n=1 Tax=Saccharothrix espanaensis (strain ATCC 51144 / DSM 44229 / JCM 9112 / NBRC 15066 / NRRL 15764) TaxID=1179773 RepID=K0K4U6_SACES|nr:hypothetical protein [Saccharothrix espanaensis]CCH31543.1 hypothetical protein BN6_42580 [Saccharothrix espanaensis DSM 44229]